MSELSSPSLNTPPAAGKEPRNGKRFACRAAAGAIAAALCYAAFALALPQYTPAAVGRIVENLTGANPLPIKLLRPPAAPLSAVAQLGKQMFFDPSLSASGRQSCASCHSPAHAYGPPNALPAQFGGPGLTLQGYRPPPSLKYLERQANFSIGPDPSDSDAPINLVQLASQNADVQKAQKIAGTAAPSQQMVPQGGMFWDGRVDTLQQQASGPMLNPVEMANPSLAAVAKKLQTPAYRQTFMQLFGPDVFNNPQLAVSEAMFAIARYEYEDPSFHPYDSKYDYWLEGRARLTHAELRGLRLFNDPNKANCAGCHLSQPGRDGLPPLFTDTQYEALGVPRNPALAQNRDPHFYDMGICGPFRSDLKTQTQYCGMFLTPTLRNVATRHVFFHNGVYHTLAQVLTFYNARDTDPAKVYPRGADGRIRKYDDLPQQYWKNIDVADAPFDRKFGDPPAMTDADMRDIIAFLQTLNDGYGAQH
jgi:cytochrome c peroxidase